ncbi:MAG TPA: polyphosphate kinase 1 [Solirubrobacteraceae bacterium]|nr:polyphosphate kinase 1 [Solirubrobacteraceae bacterium]
MSTPAEIAAQDPIRAVAPPEPDPEPEADFESPGLYTNRELSWVDFNDRVLQLVEDSDLPLLERVKFAAIWTSNFDEFFMIRVAGVHDQVEAGLQERGPDGHTPNEVLDAIRAGAVDQYERHCRCLQRELRPALAEHGVHIVAFHELDEDARAAVTERYRRQIFPVLTPLAVGLGRPFPYISNLSLSLAVLVRDPQTRVTVFARVKVPKELLPRFVPVDGERPPGGTPAAVTSAAAPTHTFVPLEDVIAAHLDDLFPGMEVLEHGVFRVTRDADFEVSDEADDLLRAIEAELRRRRFGEAVRVEIDARMDQALRAELTRSLHVEERQVYAVDGLLDGNDLWQFVDLPGLGDLREQPCTSVTQPRLQGDGPDAPDLFAEMRRGPILVHHPYDSFATSVERFVEQAAADPDVLAIKQTVYRTSDDTPLIPALIRATERGKQAVCLVELKARFDERANIGWARALEQAGVHVVYGHPALKTHAKAILVVRREGDGVRPYVHVGTGNYHPTNARLYTDFGLFTTDEDIGADVADMFNFLTGFARPRDHRKAIMAPEQLRTVIIEEIERTAACARDGRSARIRMKMNSLVDRRCIRALYRASQAGVDIELNVRGICSLRARVPGVSERIRVVSVLGRFLEHARIFAFERDGEEPRVLIGSADLMPRNLDTRVELMVPVDDDALRDDLLDTLDRSLADERGAWELQPDGSWAKLPAGPGARSVQHELMAKHAARAVADCERTVGD